MSLIVLLVQIIVESLPISSSGHCVLLPVHTVSKELLWIAHMPTVIAMLVVLYPRWTVLVRNPCRTYMQWMHLALYGVVASAMTLPLYMILQSFVANSFPVWMGFCITALLLVSVSAYHRTMSTMSVYTAVLIGCAQGVAVLPGISRLGITYVVGRWCGLSAAHAFDFSCTLALPVFFTAALYGLYTVTSEQLGAVMTVYALMLLLGATVCGVLLLYGCRLLLLHGYAWIFSCYLVLPIVIALLC